MPNQAIATLIPTDPTRRLMQESLAGRLIRSEGELGSFGVFTDTEREGHLYDLVMDEDGLWELVSPFGQRLVVRVNSDGNLVDVDGLYEWLNLQADNA